MTLKNDTGAASAMKKVLETAKSQAKPTTVTNTDTNAKTERFAEIESNVFTQIIFDSKRTLEEKRKAVTEAQVVDVAKSKDENLARLEEYNLFKDFMQERRREQAMAVIRAIDTEVFGRLQGIIDNMNQKVLDFDNAMEPLMNTISAVHALNKGGVNLTNLAFKEIQADEEADRQHARALAEKEAALGELNSEKKEKEDRIFSLQTDKEFRNWVGVIKGIYKSEIALLQQAIPDLDQQIAAQIAVVEEARKPLEHTSELADPEQIAAKAELRNMLNITGPEHKLRQEALVKSALEFVTTTDEQLRGVMLSFDSLKKGISEVDANNVGTQKIYSILTDATVEANKQNEELRKKYDPPADPASETNLGRLEREEKKSLIDEYVGAMVASSMDTVKVSSELQQEAFRIKTGRETINGQIARTRSLQSSGNAGIASRLSTTLQAVNAAAVNESTGAAENTMTLMNDKTNAINMNEAIRAATGISEQNNSLTKAVNDLAEMAEGLRMVSTTTRDNMREALESKQKLEDLVGQVSGLVKESAAASADALGATFAEAAAPVANDNATATAAKPAKKATAAAAFDIRNV